MVLWPSPFSLADLVKMGGLSDAFRRQALDELIECGATPGLDALADDPSVPPSLAAKRGGQMTGAFQGGV